MNDKGQLPLHLACSGRVFSRGVIDMLIMANPNGLSAYDRDGFLPFHVACIYGRTSEIVEYLITKLDGAILPATKTGIPALFLACERNANLDVILMLVQNSLEVFSGDMLSDGGDKHALACAENLRSRRKRNRRRRRVAMLVVALFLLHRFAIESESLRCCS